MSLHKHAVAAVALGCLVLFSVSSYAQDDDQQQTPGDILYVVGQIAGAAVLCKVAVADINAVVAKAFQALDLPLEQGSDSYKRFADGVTDGGKQVNSGAAKCQAVADRFRELQERYKE